MSVETIKIISSLFSIFGSAILAYRVTGILSALSLVANAHELSIQQLMPNNTGSIYNLRNSMAHAERARKTGLLLTGFVFIIVAGVLQFIALLLESL